MGTIYRSIYCLPDSYAIDMSLDQIFSCRVQGSSIDAYRLIIKDLSNVTKYDSTKITLSTVLYNDETLNITVPANSVTTRSQLKFTIQTFSGVNSATTREISFYNYSTPTAALSIVSPVISKQIELTTIYTQTQSIPVESYQYFLYDSTGSTLLQQSDLFYTEKLKYIFDGLLDATSYQAQCIITNKYSQIVDTGKISFNVDYTQPNINITPTTNINEELSAVEIGIGQAIQNIGESTGTINYIDNYLVVGNTGIELVDDISTIFWNVNITADFTDTFTWQTTGFTDGKIIKYEDSLGNYLEIGYSLYDNPVWFSDTIIDTERTLDLNSTYELTEDASVFLNDLFGINIIVGSFYLNVSGVLVIGLPMNLNSDPYVIGVENSKVYIQQNNTILDIIKPWWIN